MKKKVLLGLLIIFCIIQFFRPTRNQNTDITSNHIYNLYNTGNNVKIILDKACNDCHSNFTKYPWYSNIQPIAWFLNNHVVDGKKHLNFSEFGSYNTKRQNKKIEEVIEVIKENEMPLSSYTLIHTDAKLSDEEKTIITNWAKVISDSIKIKNPNSISEHKEEDHH